MSDFIMNAQRRAKDWTPPKGDIDLWSDHDKLFALALVLDANQLGTLSKPLGYDPHGGDSIQRDLWRIAEDLALRHILKERES